MREEAVFSPEASGASSENLLRAAPGGRWATAREPRKEIITQQTAEEFQPLARQRILRGRQRPPDRRRIRDGFAFRRERLDHHGAIVADFAQTLRDLRPSDEAGAGCAAVIFATVHVRESRTGEADRFQQRFFLDVHVKRIEMDFDRRRADFIHQAHRLRGGVNQIGFKTIERLDRERHAGVGGDFTRLAQTHDGALPLDLALRIRQLPPLTDGGIHRPREHGAAPRLRERERPANVGDTLAAKAFIFMREIARRTEGTAHDRFQPRLAQRVRHRAVGREMRRIFDGDFEGVEAHGLGAINKFGRGVAHRRRPDPGIDTEGDAHGKNKQG